MSIFDVLSDHAIVVVLFGNKHPTPQCEQPLSCEVLKSDAFKTFFDIYYDDVFNPQSDPPEQLATLKLIIRAAASKARSSLNTFKDSSGGYRPELYFTMARLVWRNDLVTAQMLIASSPCAKKHMQIVENVVSTIDPDIFEKDYAFARTCSVQKKIDDIATAENQMKNRSLFPDLVPTIFENN